MGTLDEVKAMLPLRRDSKGVVISGGSKIIDTKEVSISAAGWVAVTLGTTDHCKSIFVRTRDGAEWYLSAQSGGTRYLTIARDFSMDLVADPSETIFYAKGSTTTTLEVLLLD